MLKNYMTTITFARSKKPEGDSVGKAHHPPPLRRESGHVNLRQTGTP
jgi:hypothetical protein